MDAYGVGIFLPSACFVRLHARSMAATKDKCLPRPWPLLGLGQDPESIEARVAFHLHRLKLVGRPMHRCGFHTVDAADLAAGRTPLSEDRVDALAQRLGVVTIDLIRRLTECETREWAFY